MSQGLDKFEEAYAFVKRWEGGYVNHPSDPGGETNFGITKSVAVFNGYSGPMKDIPLDLVKKIYREKYWDKCGCGNMETKRAIAVFDTAVNCGVARANSWNAAHESDWDFLKQRQKHYENLIEFKESFAVFKKGWFNRLNDLAKLALNVTNFTDKETKA